MDRLSKTGKPAMLLGLVLVLLMLIAACGEADDNPGSGGNAQPTPTQAPSSTPTPQPVDHPQGASDVVVKIEHVGGFVMQETIVTRMPHFALYGDGSVITQGPQIAIYPAPALPNLQMGTLTGEGIQKILVAAREAGLLDGDKEYRLDMIADAATTVFTITAAGETHTVSVYALMLAEEELNNDMVPEDEREARQKLAEFEAMMLDYMSWLPAEAVAETEISYPMEQLQIVVVPRDMFMIGDGSIDVGEMDWPLETPLARIGDEYPFLQQASCAVIEGDDLGTLVDALNEANELTTWISEGDEYALLLRPILPDETGCTTPQM